MNCDRISQKQRQASTEQNKTKQTEKKKTEDPTWQGSF